MAWLIAFAVAAYVVALVFLFALFKVSADVDAAGLRAEREAFEQSEAEAAATVRRILAASTANRPTRDAETHRSVAEC